MKSKNLIVFLWGLVLLNITIITIGKLKEKYLKDAITEYSKRLTRFCRLDIIEIQDEKIPDMLSEKEEEKIRFKEGEGILRNLKNDAYKIALCIDGNMLSSEGFSNKLNSIAIDGKSSIIFIIGGSIGLSKDVIKMCDMKLSFSNMTFPHQLMRVILLEQIYRAFKISNNEIYHK